MSKFQPYLPLVCTYPTTISQKAVTAATRLLLRLLLLLFLSTAAAVITDIYWTAGKSQIRGKFLFNLNNVLSL